MVIVIMNSLDERGIDSETFTMERDCGEYSDTTIKQLDRAKDRGIKLLAHFHPHGQKCIDRCSVWGEKKDDDS